MFFSVLVAVFIRHTTLCMVPSGPHHHQRLWTGSVIIISYTSPPLLDPVYVIPLTFLITSSSFPTIDGITARRSPVRAGRLLPQALIKEGDGLFRNVLSGIAIGNLLWSKLMSSARRVK
ncbi:hypothetical protein PIB30_062495 [Stylosanthes scabra]|uniref:Uncharacterized protein n=1 Tax=Stylosanthes scabra TaxID=79078 RepID=A0ABU6TKZ1_9FABA|nr:hypothetical protein [Stylosanthes scabra]